MHQRDPEEDFNPLCSSVSIQSCDQPTKLFNQTTKSRISKRVFLSTFQFPCPSNTLTNYPIYQPGIKWIIQPKRSKRCFLSFRQFVCRPILLNNQPNQAIGKEKSFSHGTLTLDLIIICPWWSFLDSLVSFWKMLSVGLCQPGGGMWLILMRPITNAVIDRVALSPFGNMINYWREIQPATERNPEIFE